MVNTDRNISIGKKCTVERENEFEWNQFIRFGDMIGDGLHYEEPWISKEYKRLAKILILETKEVKEHKRNLRLKKNENINNQITERLKTDKCHCGKELKQVRSGSKIVTCIDISCGKRYKYKTKKKK